MRLALICCTSAIALTAVSSFAVAPEVPTLQNPESYSAGTAPDSVTKKTAATTKEKPKAIVGSNYAVVTQAVDQIGKTDSYLRLFNGGAAATTFSVTIVNSATGATVGTAVIAVPPRAAPQKILRDLIALAKPGVAGGGTYALYIQSPEPTAGYQHVSYNGFTDLFENVSVCKVLLNEAVAPVANSIVMMNMHTSLLEGFGYPSQLELHNFADVPKTYRATIIDAASGTIKGQIDIPTAANTSYTLPFVSALQAPVNWAPSAAANEFQANVIITDVTGAVPNAIVGQSIVIPRITGTANMSMACAVNPVGTAAGGGGGADPGNGGFGGGGITY